MKRYLVEYIAVVIVLMGWDAMSSSGERVRYQVVPSLLVSLFWPITMPVTILIAALKTRHFPEARS